MLVIYYSPGARGDFLSLVLQDQINQETQFKSPSADYKKLHDFNSFNRFYQRGITSYNIRIFTNTANELINSTLLHFSKNKTHLCDDNFYDFLFIVAKNTFIENEQSKYLNYSYSINFLDFYNLDIISDLYVNYTNKKLSSKHIDFILKNNRINSEYLKYIYIKILKLLKYLNFLNSN